MKMPMKQENNTKYTAYQIRTATY